MQNKMAQQHQTLIPAIREGVSWFAAVLQFIKTVKTVCPPTKAHQRMGDATGQSMEVIRKQNSSTEENAPFGMGPSPHLSLIEVLLPQLKRAIHTRIPKNIARI